ncbi:MAG: hypothetical protein WEC59_03125 [Salibacteraceae bacterium]
MRLIHIISSALFMLVMAKCKTYTEPDLQPANDPIFMVNGNINGNQLDFMADGNHFVQSSFGIDSLNITYYEAAMTSCIECSPRFALRWRASEAENPEIITTLQHNEPEYRYATSYDTLEFYDVKLQAVPYETVDNYTWIINGESYSGSEVNLSFPRDDDFTRFPLQLEVTYSNGCNASIADTIYLPNHGCDCNISVRMLDSITYEYTAVTAATSAVEYDWEFESGAKASSRKVIYPFNTIPEDGVEIISAKTKVGDCRASNIYNQYFNTSTNTCAINFDSEISTRTELVPGGLSIDLGEIEIEYTDMEGNLYRSMLVQQSTNSFFKVSSIEEYIDPYISSDMRSIKVQATFDCLLSNGTETIRIQDGKLILPLGLGAD